ncbi:MAG: LuxR family transcriptional regulator [Ramlibacter sp.]|jgi:DNA-binding CsgD family transcriptional regulator|nr:LuxR family transcriptional regulator [Ramlibacter sp.]
MNDALGMIYAVTTANSRDELVQRMHEAVRALGCEHFMLGVEVHRPALDPVQDVTSGYPERWQRRYVEKGYVRMDPTVPHCQQHTTPLVWHDGIYADGSIELLEEARSHGLSHGLSIGVHETRNSKSMVSLARDRPIDSDAREQQEIVQAATVLATCAHMAAIRLIVPDLLAGQSARLTPREHDCLRLVMQGKSTSVISDLLRISEPTVDFHVKNVMRKLGVATRVQAVAKAVSLGLLD